MNIFVIYLIYIYINAGVEAYPRLFLKGVYTNKLDKYYVYPNNIVRGYRFTEIRKEDAINIKECAKLESREECLRRIKRHPTEYVRGLSKPSGHEKDYIRESIEEVNNGFSQDYLDINDLLLRTNSDSSFEHPISKQKPTRSQYYKVLKPNKYDRFTFDLTNIRRNNRNKKAYESDDSDSSTSSESKEMVRKKKVAKNKRFQVIDKSMESDSESSEEIQIEKKKSIKKNNKLMYMQSPSRLYDFRRRLEHFLPKRYYWNTDDMKELGDYWYNGPKAMT